MQPQEPYRSILFYRLVTREYFWEVRGLNRYTERREMNPCFHFQGTLSTGVLWKTYMVALLKSYIPSNTFVTRPFALSIHKDKNKGQYQKADLKPQKDSIPLWCGSCWWFLLYPAKEQKLGRAEWLIVLSFPPAQINTQTGLQQLVISRCLLSLCGTTVAVRLI